MNIKKYLFVAIGAFFIVVIVVIGISARFNLSNITADPYTFIENFFTHWSPALSAAGTFIVAAFAFLAIYESRRSQRLALYNQYFSKLEEWAQTNKALLSRAKQALRLCLTVDKTQKSADKILNGIESDIKTATKHGEDVRKRLDASKELVKTSRELIRRLEGKLGDVEGICAQAAYGEMIARPVVRSIGDNELQGNLDLYLNLVLELGKAIESGDLEHGLEVITVLEQGLRDWLDRVTYLRSKMTG